MLVCDLVHLIRLGGVRSCLLCDGIFGCEGDAELTHDGGLQLANLLGIIGMVAV